MGRAQGSPRILRRWAVREDNEDDEDGEDGDIAGFCRNLRGFARTTCFTSSAPNSRIMAYIFCYLQYKSVMDCWLVKVLSLPSMNSDED